MFKHQALIFFFAAATLSSTSFADNSDRSVDRKKRLEKVQEPIKLGCVQKESGEWVDRVQAKTYSNLCKTVRWIDGLFGEDKEFDSTNFRGKLIVGLVDEEREKLDFKLRLRLKSELPNMSNRFKAFIGRLDEDEFLRENSNKGDSLLEQDTISRNSGDDEASWLIGLGYKRFPDRGFSYSIGGKFSSGFKPYAKIKHRYLTSVKSPHYLAFNQLAYIQKDDGYGFSTSYDYSYELSDNDILRWGSGLKYTEELEKWEGSSSVTWFHNLGNNYAFSLRGFVKDVEDSPVSIPEYGMNVSYRQPIYRDWLRLRLGLENRWVKELADKPRDSIYKFAIQLEMLFGKK